MRLSQFACCVVLAFGAATCCADQIDDANAEVARIVREIKESGPPELRNLPASQIASTARPFVFGAMSGSISPAQLARMGGARQATENALQASVKLSGQRP
jgi:hypothetical protein